MIGIDQIPVDLLAQAFDKLPARLREPLFLVRAKGLSCEEAAMRLGVPVIQIERRIAKALARLDRDLERMKWHEWRRW
jgi:DNA-directed RNA polymerase specialized sigma24 family protein